MPDHDATPLSAATPQPWSVSRRRAMQLAGGLTAAGLTATSATEASATEQIGRSGGAILTEGTNMMVAAAPDGSRLAVDLVTAIWVLDATGGDARRLTDDLQDASRPSWSPDGELIAFQAYRDGNYHLWTIRPDGSDLRQHTTGRHDHREPVFTRDGTALVFSSDRGGSYGIHRIELATGAITTLTDTEVEEGEPTLSADGSRLAFTVDASSIDEVELATGSRRTVVAAEDGSSVFGPAYRPGDDALAYVRLTGPRSDLMLGDDRVTDDRDVFALPPSWGSPDDLYYTADGSIHRLRVGADTTVVPFAAIVPVTSRRPRPQTPDIESTAPRKALGIASPTASPDGRWLSFRALNALWLADLSGREKPRRIVADGYFNSDPDFAPDGATLLYASDRAGTADLWTHDLTTGEDRRASDLPGAQLAPRYSPDGTMVAYHDQDGIGWIVDLAGGQPRQITPPLFMPGRMSWARDGRTIVLAAVKPFSRRFREGTSQLLYVDLDTGELEYVAPMPFRSLGTRGDDGPVFSPDGRHLAFVVESLLYVVPVDDRGRFTGEPYAVTDETTDSPVWLDDRNLLYLNNGRLRRTDLSGSRSRTIALDLTWRRPKIRQRLTIHAGALWDGRSTSLRREVDVLIDGSRIAAVRPHQGRADIDASALTVMPGLIDAHNHWHLRGRAWGARQGLLWLSYGVTTTRSPGDPAYQMVETREALAAGALVGPRFFGTGEAIDGSRVYYNFMRPTLSVRQLAREIDRVEGLAYDLVKTYVRLPIDLQRRVVTAVHRLGLRLSSHYLYPAQHLGMDGMEHYGATNRLGYSQTVSRLGRTYADVVTLFSKSGISITPTLFTSTMMHVDDPSLLNDQRTTTLFTPWEYRMLLDEVARASGPAGETTRATLNGHVEMMLRIHRGGGLVIAGTDTPLDNIAISLHANLRAMVAGGFTPYEALTIATRNPARWLNLEDKLGVVAPGAQADLAFVEGNPLTDIKTAAHVRQVMLAGQLHTVDELLAPFSSPTAADAPATVRANGPEPLANHRERAHAHDRDHWWHEPEWLHRLCCDG